ncbi:FAD-binding oxidoreductase [Pokkaliibacter plantistimulans]|uniref:D-2-hydroxyglutarate dehydrogenase n=1 Tax=Proteobacteria bacterium 228 TaxID=2083153 RepID=A0A2S5KNG5_9PROT|nr:FAD-binding and (Fe-S)-binding domain-containing protein [Pokkaliibacter plantistimulans]PPC76069.1 FAD-binding oxidoreductase [Pokkaliibacter plantistimulans]
MIPRLAEVSPLHSDYLAFLDALKAQGFEGDVNPDYANRTVLATDNSIYQVMPQGVLYPASAADLQRIAQLLNQPRFHKVKVSPRGGGTGTNGQSLNDGLLVDVSKHMNQIIEINAAERWVRVQAGVVKDQLNAALKPYGLFFAPELSTSNRATIGGMINTDASGQGSVRYGKTRDHVLELHSVLLDGTLWHSSPLTQEQLEPILQRQDRVGEIHRLADSIQRTRQEEISATFPKLNRCLTGYDLAHIRDEQQRFDLNALLCGSEGTLAFITEAKLNVLPIPKYSALVNVQYGSFNAALRDAQGLMRGNPTSIETVDSKVLNLAMQDIIWHSVAQWFPQTSETPIQGINLVEFTGDDEAILAEEVNRLTAQLDAEASGGVRLGYTVAMGNDNVKQIWGMRKKSVGLLGNAQGERRPIPFVEDTAVPPENLADYILEFRALLDSHGLQYGMFGHVDAGVLHVRPAIDMKDPEQEPLVRIISDGVVALTQKYKGLIWGEHGKGVRSEYGPAFFGDLYACLQELKGTFDPYNQLNPGKIATPAKDGATLLKIDEVPTRGQFDRTIPVASRLKFEEGMHCNGNGACFNFDPDDAMCPSWKGTRQRIHSPKGRSSLIREWLRLMQKEHADPVQLAKEQRQSSAVQTFIPKVKNTLAKRRGEYDFSHEVHEAMVGCLACKSCAGQCPIKVNVPELRSQFLELYYGRYLRPLKDYFIGTLEFVIPYLARTPWLYNGLMGNGLTRKALQKYAGMVDSPRLSDIRLDRAMASMGVPFATQESLQALTADQRSKAVIIVQDAFTSYFDTQVVTDILALLSRLGFQPMVAPFRANGKPLHVHGFLKQFTRTAERQAQLLNTLAATGIPLVGIDPSMTLTYRSEYKKYLAAGQAPQVQLLQEWLAEHVITLQSKADCLRQGSFKLLAHCTEKTNAAPSVSAWQKVFAALGQELAVINTGCCGMSGTYGHETANLGTSKTIYGQSWAKVVNDPANQGKLTATGYSCRSQVKRMDDQQLPHPLQILLQQLH